MAGATCQEIFPPWQSVYYHFAKWRDMSLWRKLNKHLRRRLPKQLGRDEEPSAGVVDSQSIKGSVHQGNGYDGGKKVNGRKRHLLVDTLGLLLEVVVSAANVSDQQGMRALLRHARHELPRLHHLWVDQSYRGAAFINAMLLAFGVVLEVVSTKERQKGFCLQARRWVAEMSQP